MIRVYFGHHKMGSVYCRNHILRPLCEQLGLHCEEVQVKGVQWRLDDGVGVPLIDSSRDAMIEMPWASELTVPVLLKAYPELRGFHVVRDFRNALVSCYFHHRDGHIIRRDDWYWLRLDETRKVLQSVSKEEGLLYTFDNIYADLMEHQIRPWPYQQLDNVLEIKLEQITANPLARWTEIFDFLRLSVPESVVKDLVDKSDWGELNRKSPKHFRSKSPREWEKHFTPDIGRRFEERYGDLLRLYGYD